MWWKNKKCAASSLARPNGPILLASTSLSSSSPLKTHTVAKSAGLPGEGTIYDHIGIGNFVDLEKNKFTASITKSIHSNALSNLLDADLPLKLTVGGKLGHAWFDGLQFSPVGKVGLQIRLLDLGGGDSRQGGYLRFKTNTRTNGRTDHGFEIDRKVALMNLRHTTLYGNVSYRTTNRANGSWKTTSSFGVHQAFRIAGAKCAVRLGMTPEGEFVYDLRL